MGKLEELPRAQQLFQDYIHLQTGQIINQSESLYKKYIK
jgi:hypothetical protein